MIPIIIVSHKRPGNVKTFKAISNCVLCVEKSQEEAYRRHYPDCKYLIHPDNIVGLSPKRQWIMEQVGDCFQVDDDITSVRRVYLKSYKDKPLILTPDEAYYLLQDLYEIAKDAGAHLFGLNRTVSPVAFNGAAPVAMNKYICGGGLGLIRSDNLFFPNYPDFVGEDYWINCLNAYYYRYSYIDQRFTFQFTQTEAAKGGCSDYRTEQKRKETYFYLKRKFGDAIQPKKNTPVKKCVNKWEKTLKIPY